MANDTPLQDQVAIVTGASSGIGTAVARALAGAGATVALAARRLDRLERLAEKIEADGGSAHVQVTDVTRRDEVESLAAGVLDIRGRIDILVNNAGVMPLSPVESLRVEDWDRMIDVNFRGVLHGFAAVLPTMLDQGRGHIVNIGSVAGRRPFPGGTVYAATKFAVRALTAGIQLELSAERGIRVTDVQPGIVDTELMDHIPDASVRERFETGWAERRKLQPDDVANAVLFAATAPEHVNINEILVRPTDQTT